MPGSNDSPDAKYQTWKPGDNLRTRDHSQEEAAVDPIDAMKLSDAQRDSEECDDPDCACHEDAGRARPGDGAAEVTMTEVYDPGCAY